MKFSLIICTYMRPQPLLNLLDSVKQQTLYPDEILIVDGSTDTATQIMLEQNPFDSLRYFKVDSQNRGLTKQRNFGVAKVSDDTDVVCFLDDDIVLTKTYFQVLMNTYENYDKALAVGGYIINEVNWIRDASNMDSKNQFHFDGWVRTEPFRFRARHWFGLEPDASPGFFPTFSHGRSIGFLPPSGKVYQVEQLMGGVSSYKKEVFQKLKFSTYFEGYGLYEDADFSLRVSKLGTLYVNTKAQLYHYHDDSGRPNKFKYGQMVIRNGWYVWRIKYPKPSLKARVKWNLTALLLTMVRFTNVINTSKKKEAFTESLGRLVGWWSLVFNKPKIER